MNAHREPGRVVLLAKVLRDTPKLSGALCVHRSVIFDADQDDPAERDYAIARAKKLCSSWPCLDRSHDWASQQDRLVGVVAGRVNYFGERQPAA
jgi:hypothetical protein